MGKSLIDHSKTVYETEVITAENISAGALQRIATATEAMAKNYQQLQAEAARWKNSFEFQIGLNEKLMSEIATQKKSIASFKGQITKLKKLLK